MLVYTDDGDAALAEVHAPRRRTPSRCWCGAASLEDVFLRLTGRTLVD